MITTTPPHQGAVNRSRWCRCRRRSSGDHLRRSTAGHPCPARSSSPCHRPHSRRRYRLPPTCQRRRRIRSGSSRACRSAAQTGRDGQNVWYRRSVPRDLHISVAPRGCCDGAVVRLGHDPRRTDGGNRPGDHDAGRGGTCTVRAAAMVRPPPRPHPAEVESLTWPYPRYASRSASWG